MLSSASQVAFLFWAQERVLGSSVAAAPGRVGSQAPLVPAAPSPTSPSAPGSGTSRSRPLGGRGLARPHPLEHLHLSEQVADTQRQRAGMFSVESTRLHKTSAANLQGADSSNSFITF